MWKWIAAIGAIFALLSIVFVGWGFYTTTTRDISVCRQSGISCGTATVIVGK